MTDTACLYPLNAPKTAYGKGCRCSRCVEAERERCRRRYAANLEAERARIRRYYATHREEAAERQRRRYERDREGIREQWRRWRENSRERERERGQRRRERLRSISVTSTGRYTAEEDQIVLAWEGSDLDLAL